MKYTLSVQDGYKYILRSASGVFLGFTGDEGTLFHLKALPNVRIVGNDGEGILKFAPTISDKQLQALTNTIKFLDCTDHNCFEYMFNVSVSGNINSQTLFNQVHYIYHYSSKTYGSYSTDMVLQYRESILKYQNCIDFAKSTYSLAPLPDLYKVLERQGGLLRVPDSSIDFNISRFASIVAKLEEGDVDEDTDFESFYLPIKGTAKVTSNRATRRSGKQRTILDNKTLPALVVHGLLLNKELSLSYFTNFTTPPPPHLYQLIIESILDESKRKLVTQELVKLGAPIYKGTN